MVEYDSFQQAWLAVLSRLLKAERVPGVIDPLSVGSGFGKAPRDTRELLADGFILRNPRNRCAHSSTRPVHAGFAIANFLWTLSGSSLLDDIACYNGKGILFSDDGKNLPASMGFRMFGGGRDLFAPVVSRLATDPQTRRAFIAILDSTDSAKSTRDVPCASSIQFVVRHGALDCIVNMRSQSAFGVLPYDVFLFTMLQEAVATQLNLPLGRYIHLCTSLHIYLDEEAQVSRFLGEEEVVVNEMGAMNPSALKIRSELVLMETWYRSHFFNSEVREPMLPINPSVYWQGLFNVLIKEYTKPTVSKVADLALP